MEVALDRIAKAHTTEEKVRKDRPGSSNRYKHAFCLVMDNGKKAVTKVMMPPALVNSALFRTGVDISKEGVK